MYSTITGDQTALEGRRLTTAPSRVARLAALLLLGWLAAALLPAQTLEPKPAPVVFDGKALFELRTRVGSFLPADRAAKLQERMAVLAVDPFFDPEEMKLREGPGYMDLLHREQILFTVTTDDAEVEKLPLAQLAQDRLASLRDAIVSYRETKDKSALGRGVFFILVCLAVIGALFWLSNRIFPHLYRRVIAWRDAHSGQFSHRWLNTFGVHRVAAALLVLIWLQRLLFFLLILYGGLVFCFRQLPWTRTMSYTLLDYGAAPFRTFGQGLWMEVPNLMFIAVTVLCTVYLLRVLKWLFIEARDGRMSIPGVDSWWAESFYKIIRVLVLLFVAVAVYPYVPGARTPAFQGITIFLGALFSLGSASSMSNLLNGIVLMRMRPFQIGDRVRIGPTVGTISGVSLLFTRVRTDKNVDVTVPNSQILAQHIENYSSLGSQDGHLVHTTITIGYDVPWRQVHELLIAAARDTALVEAEPAPFVLQKALNDYHVAYEINASTRAADNRLPRIYAELHSRIQDKFHEAGVEIMSPAYTALRDGNTAAVPPDNRPRGYRPPGFRVETASPTDDTTAEQILTADEHG